MTAIVEQTKIEQILEAAEQGAELTIDEVSFLFSVELLEDMIDEARTRIAEERIEAFSRDTQENVVYVLGDDRALAILQVISDELHEDNE